MDAVADPSCTKQPTPRGSAAQPASVGRSAADGKAVAVVIVNWNGRHHLERCLPALERQEHSPDEVVVVDNGSSDGSVSWLRREWPWVRVIALEKNTGFAAANNRGIEETHAPWLALLNNDTVPSPGWLKALLAEANGDDRIASVASRMLFLDAPEIINSAGIAVDLAGIAWDRLGGAPQQAGESRCEVFGACAGAGLFRRSALVDAAERIGDGCPQVFDEQYFMYLEDVDLAWRLRLRRWRSVYSPAAIVWHKGSGSAGEGSAFKNYLLARNKVWTLLKDYPSPALLAFAPAIVGYDLASAPYRLFIQGQSAAFRGRLAALRELRTVLAKRRAIQARRLAPWPEIRSALSGLASPWAVARRYRHLRQQGLAVCLGNASKEVV